MSDPHTSTPLASQVVFTGLGLVSPLGGTPQDTWEGVSSGRIGIGPLTQLEQAPPLSRGAATGGQACGVPPDYWPSLPRVERFLRFAVESALAQSQAHRVPAARVAIVLGSTLHGMPAAGAYLRSGDPRALQGFLAGRVLDDALIELKIGPIRLTTCSACSSGLGSVGLGATLLRAGVADVVLVGGYDTVSEYAYGGFDSLRLVAAGPPRPFDADRDGMKVAEAYAVLAMEFAPHAASRRVDPLAALGGFGETSDAFHLTQPHPEGIGASSAMQAALSASSLAPGQIDMVSAHATATQNNDAAEYAALARTFGPSLSNTPVVAFKSLLGHTLGGAGGAELALSVLARQNGLIPATAGTQRVDPAFAGLRLVKAPTPATVRNSLNLSLGFGGANTCVVLTDPARPVPAVHLQPDEAVISGVGIVLPGAVGIEEFRALMLAASPVTSDTGCIPESRYEALVQARRTRRMSEYAKLTLAAASAAWLDAGLTSPDPHPEECCALLGTTHGSTGFCESYYETIVKSGLDAANPVLFAEGVPNAAAAHLSMAFGLKGSCQTLIGTRSAALHALMLAAMRIREGVWTRAIVSAAEEYSGVINAAYRACGLYGGPDGFVTGSGGVAFILESRRAAESRGVTAWCTLGNPFWADDSATRSLEQAHCSTSPGRSVWSSLGPTIQDRHAAHQVARSARAGTCRSVADLLPELFSVGPLAALTAGLFCGTQDFMVLSREFNDNCCGLHVTNATGRRGNLP